MLKECMLDMNVSDVMNQTDDIFGLLDIKLMIRNVVASAVQATKK